MRQGLLVLALLLPSLVYSQEAPASLPASAPASVPASQSASTSAPSSEPASSTSAPALELRPPSAFNRSPLLSYRLSLFPTLVGYAGALTFATVDFLNVDKDFDRLWLSFGALALVGPSIGHLYSGEYFRGLRLLARRLAVPGLLAGTGMIVVLVSTGGSIASLFDGEGDGASRPALLGLMIGGSMVSYAIPSISIMSGRHIRDAKKAPFREAKERKLPPPIIKKPVRLVTAPLVAPDASSLGLSFSVKW